MNKPDLIAKIAVGADVSKVQANRMVETLTGAITEALAAGDHVTLTGFGRFTVISHAERQGRNPRTGETILIPAHKIARFTAGKTLRDVVQS